MPSLLRFMRFLLIDAALFYFQYVLPAIYFEFRLDSSNDAQYLFD